MPRIVVDIPEGLLSGSDGETIEFERLVKLLANRVGKELRWRDYLKRHNGRRPNPYDLSDPNHPANQRLKR